VTVRRSLVCRTMATMLAVVLALGVGCAAPAVALGATAAPAGTSGGGTSGESPAPMTVHEAVDLALAQNPALAQALAARRKADLTCWATDEMITPLKRYVSCYRLVLLPGEPPTGDLGAVDTLLVLRQAEAGRAIAHWAADYARESLRLQAVTAFYGVLKAEKLHDISAQALERAVSQLAMAISMRDAGVATQKDVLDAEVGVANAEAARSSATGVLEQARMGFNQALGRPLTTAVVLRGDLAYTALDLGRIDLAADVAWALERGFEVRQAQETLNVAEYDLGLTHDYPASNYDREIAAAARDEAAQGLTLAQQAAEFGVRAACLALVDAQARVECRQRAVAAAQEAARLSELRYQNGMATSLEVSTAQLALSQADAQLVEAMYDHRLAQLQLHFASGKSLVGAP